MTSPLDEIEKTLLRCQDDGLSFGALAHTHKALAHIQKLRENVPDDLDMKGIPESLHPRHVSFSSIEKAAKALADFVGVR